MDFSQAEYLISSLVIDLVTEEITLISLTVNLQPWIMIGYSLHFMEMFQRSYNSVKRWKNIWSFENVWGIIRRDYEQPLNCDKRIYTYS